MLLGVAAAGGQSFSQRLDEAMYVPERVVERHRCHSQHAGLPHVTLQPDMGGKKKNNAGKNSFSLSYWKVREEELLTVTPLFSSSWKTLLMGTEKESDSWQPLCWGSEGVRIRT